MAKFRVGGCTLGIIVRIKEILFEIMARFVCKSYDTPDVNNPVLNEIV